jgi:hypothetical protein
MSADDRAKDGATKPAWATTEPLPNPVAAARGEAPSPDSSGSLDASGLPKKIAEVKRSAEVESILEALAYPRPHVKVDRPETDSDLAAAHHVGPRAVPAAVPTSTLEPPLMLSQSLVEAIRAPATPAPPVTKPRVDHGATVLVARNRNKRLLYALAPCAVITVLVVWGLSRSTAPAVTVPVAPAAPSPVAVSVPPIVPAPVDPPVAPAPSASAPVIASAPLPARPSPVATSPAGRPARSASPQHPAPKASATASPAPRDTSSLRTDFEVQN